MKWKLLIFVVTAFVFWIVWPWFKPVTSEQRFRALFGELSVGVPEYQSFGYFSQPDFALKGDVCAADFIQSESQFRHFATALGVSEQKILASNSFWIRAGPKINSEYPWMLQVRARVGSVPNTYDVHIEGQQPYD